MKKILLLPCLLFFISSYCQTNPRIKKGQLLAEELSFIKTTYKWNTQDFLVISFRQSSSKCHYDNYKSLRNSSIKRRGFKNMREKTITFDTKIISVSADKNKIENYIDNEEVFFDLYDFMGFRFFSKDKSCFCLIVINNKGEFRTKVGEYSIDNIIAFLTELN